MTPHLLALGVSAGAWVGFAVDWVIVALATVAAVRLRHPVVVLIAAVLLGGWWSARALQTFDPPPAGRVDGWITVTSDPRPAGPVGVRASAIWGVHRVSITAHGPLAGRLDDRLAGERVRVVGAFRPLRAGDDFARWRHEVGSISVDEIRGHSAGSPLTQATNAIRRLLADGARSLDRDDRAIFTGMVLGDDREQSAVVADDFRAAGLGHLLVVSGQNVAFMIALLGPLTRRFRPAGRLVVVAVALAGFVTMTRFEASVLRASAMAGVSVGAAVLGGPIDGRRTLSWSVVVLIALDPFLVRVLAFQLSVLATGGIVWLSGPLAARLAGPDLFRVAVSTTLGAQLAVAPLLVLVFGPVPLASLPANLLAGPASGPIMMWGWTGGLVAGLVGEPLAGWLHVPTVGLVGWVRGVAAIAATGPHVTVGALGVLGFGGAVGGALSGRRTMSWAGGAIAAFVTINACLNVPHVPEGTSALDVGVLVHRDGVIAVELDDPRRPREVLEALRLAGVRRIDLVIATDGDRADADAVIAIHRRFGPVPTVAPPLHRVPGGRSVHPGNTVLLGSLRVDPVSGGAGYELVVRACAAWSCQDSSS